MKLFSHHSEDVNLVSRCQQGWFLLGALEENSFPCLFQLAEEKITSIFASIITPASVTLLAPYYKDFWNYFVPIWVIQENPHLKNLNSTTSAKSLVPYKVM